jgi:quinol monooxygenase YgiN
MAFIVIAHCRAQPGTEQRVRAALEQMVTPTRAEPGNLSYEVCADPADPVVFALSEKYVDVGGFTAHTETPHSQKYLRGEVLPNLSHRTRHDRVQGCSLRMMSSTVSLTTRSAAAAWIMALIPRASVILLTGWSSSTLAPASHRLSS